jgi:hypothetical protein
MSKPKHTDLLSNRELSKLAKDLTNSVGLTNENISLSVFKSFEDKNVGHIRFNLPVIVKEGWLKKQVLNRIQSHFENQDYFSKGYKFHSENGIIGVENLYRGHSVYSMDVQFENYNCNILIKRL